MLSAAVPSLTPLTPESVVALAASADRLTALALLLPFRHRTVTNVMIGRALGELWLIAKASNRKHLDPGHILLVARGLVAPEFIASNAGREGPRRGPSGRVITRMSFGSSRATLRRKTTPGEPPKFSTRSTW
jgi:hypothetical protein